MTFPFQIDAFSGPHVLNFGGGVTFWRPFLHWGQLATILAWKHRRRCWRAASRDRAPNGFRVWCGSFFVSRGGSGSPKTCPKASQKLLVEGIKWNMNIFWKDIRNEGSISPFASVYCWVFVSLDKWSLQEFSWSHHVKCRRNWSYFHLLGHRPTGNMKGLMPSLIVPAAVLSFTSSNIAQPVAECHADGWRETQFRDAMMETRGRPTDHE